MEELLCWLRLQLTAGLGRTGLFRLVEYSGSPQAAIDAAGRGCWASGLRREVSRQLPAADNPRLTQLADQQAAFDGWLLTYGDADYPALLKNIPDPPALLYGRGVRTFGESLAVIGSRAPSPTGRSAAESLSHEIAAQGLTIVSGLARGVDSAAHHGALAAGGQPIAVLGCGIDRVYPPKITAFPSRLPKPAPCSANICREAIRSRGLSRAQPDHQRPVPRHPDRRSHP